MADFPSESVVGGSAKPTSPSRFRRFASGVTDLISVPIFLGVVAGLLLLSASGGIRNVILVLLNIGWMLFRDTVYSPGRTFKGRRVINIVAIAASVVGTLLAFMGNMAVAFFLPLAGWGVVSLAILFLDKPGPEAELKLVSLGGENVTVAQAFIRNILLVIPFLLVLGYIAEAVAVFVQGDRLMDRLAKTRVVTA